ncbi:MAG TPA: hypothetical protein VFQ61_02070 [Polyangiaceae bacterium]|nr:hypothetical protein [Polyangiaceae bacterium]
MAECVSMFGFDEQVDVVSLDAEVDDPELALADVVHGAHRVTDCSEYLLVTQAVHDCLQGNEHRLPT